MMNSESFFSMLEGMFRKRKKGYKAMGYQIIDTSSDRAVNISWDS
jgi:hypothetical protein